MKLIWAGFFSKGYWRHGFSLRTLIAACLAGLGTLWTLVESLSYFAPQEFTKSLQSLWWLFFLGGILAGLWETRPRHSFSCRLQNRDVEIEIIVGDIFSHIGAIIVGSNTTFDTDTVRGLISTESVQGKYTSTHYPKQLNLLDQDLSNALVGQNGTPVPFQKPGKTVAYPIGTVAKIERSDYPAYFVAIAHINEHGNAHATIDDLRTALPPLWESITQRGNLGEVAIPVLGSGFARITETRESLIREIIQSFVAACSAQRPCNALRIFISPADYYRHQVNIRELGAYLTHVCRYTSISNQINAGVGAPAP